MENSYQYFNRDISWLSFNYRVLLESEDIDLPIYERIKFLSIHASNLEEFYKIRVAEHRSIIMKKVHSEEDPAEAERILEEIKNEVTRQQQEFARIFKKKIIPALEDKHIMLYMSEKVAPFHQDFVRNYFDEEVFPFLQPVLVMKDDIRLFIRDNRLYQFVKLLKNHTQEEYYAIIKIPYAKVPRFVVLPKQGEMHYYMFVEDIISANLPHIFPGFKILGNYNVKISRDADIYIDQEISAGDNLVDTIKQKIKKRKIGDLSRFVYDRQMPTDCLNYICDTFSLSAGDVVPDNTHLSMEDLKKLPNPFGHDLLNKPFVPLQISFLEKSKTIFQVIRKQDVFLHYPYHRFNYFINFLIQASIDPNVEEIKITQYRVAEDSEVINALVNAARNGKKVTVFVELKARFDEENNLYTAEMMKQSGIRTIYSLPGLKVHAKVALVVEKLSRFKQRNMYSYLSTGNFNEKTAILYSDMALMTSNKLITKEIAKVFEVLEGIAQSGNFKTLLVSQFNLIPTLVSMIKREIRHVKQGKIGRIILKMNGLQDKDMIDELYKASEAGVEINLIVRGICCIVPNQTYSQNIHITRIVDTFLEHSRVWYFYNAGKEDVYLTSADWLKRNLYRRIETAFPILNKEIKQQIITILTIQLQDNVKACLIDDHLNNVFKKDSSKVKTQAQQAIYHFLAGKI